MDIFWQNLAVISIIVGAVSYMVYSFMNRKKPQDKCKHCQAGLTNSECQTVDKNVCKF